MSVVLAAILLAGCSVPVDAPARGPPADPGPPEVHFTQPNVTIGQNMHWKLDVRFTNIDENHTLAIGAAGFRLEDGDGLRHQHHPEHAAYSGRAFPGYAELGFMEFVDGWLVFSTASDAPRPLTLLYEDEPLNVTLAVAS